MIVVPRPAPNNPSGGKMGGNGSLAEAEQNLFAAQGECHDRQRDQQCRPEAGAQRSPDHGRIVCPERLRGERGDRRHQPHAKGEADPEDGAAKRGRRERLVAEASDEDEIGRHHRDLPKLCQRHRRGKADGLAKLAREMTAPVRDVPI